MGRPLSLDGVSTYPLASRKSKVSRASFARPHRRGAAFASFLDGLPAILAGDTVRALRDEILRARARRRPVIWGLGAHVIKVGLSPVVIDLMERGLVTAIALNGAGIVHDFELAVAGRTSEDVEAGLGTGAFGMARETGEEVNRAIVAGDRDGLGLGAAVGRYIAARRPRARHADLSLLAAAWRLGLPATVHVAIGTDIVHIHPACDPGAVGRYLSTRRPRARHLDASLLAAAWRLGLGATVHVAIGTDIVHVHPACDPGALGRATHLDFRTFAGEVARLGGGGVYLNVGSAVVLPEVFLKAVTLARNLGHPVSDFATANLDFLQSYRPGVNVVERPVRGSGRGYRLTGHHEILVPLLAAALVEKAGPRRRRR